MRISKISNALRAGMESPATKKIFRLFNKNSSVSLKLPGIKKKTTDFMSNFTRPG